MLNYNTIHEVYNASLDFILAELKLHKKRAMLLDSKEQQDKMIEKASKKFRRQMVEAERLMRQRLRALHTIER